MSNSGERRFRTERRHRERAFDLHRRLEEKRQQIERRRILRRESDRDKSSAEDPGEAAADRATPTPPPDTEPATK
jgi:hypothetical protein